MVALDSGATLRHRLIFLLYIVRKTPQYQVYEYRYFLRNSIEYCVQQFLYDPDNSENVYAKRRFDEVVLYFEDERAEECFRIDLEYHPEVINPYLEKEANPRIYTGNNALNKNYTDKVKIAKALKTLQKEWNT